MAVITVSAIISVHLGLTSTFIWYTRRTSYEMYRAMFLCAVILTVLAVVHMKMCDVWIKKRSTILEERLNIFQKGDTVRGQEGSRTLDMMGSLRRNIAWRGMLLLFVVFLFLAVSGFDFFSLDGYLVHHYKINTIFIIFTGTLSKAVIALFVFMSYSMAREFGDEEVSAFSHDQNYG